MNTKIYSEVKKRLTPEDFEAWQWAVITVRDERCHCHREVPYRESQGDAEWVDKLETAFWSELRDLPLMYVTWNTRCPVHGFPKASEEYQNASIKSESVEMESKWYQRWRDLMAQEEIVA